MEGENQEEFLSFEGSPCPWQEAGGSPGLSLAKSPLGQRNTERISVCSELLQETSSCYSVQTRLRTGADRIIVVNLSWINP